MAFLALKSGGGPAVEPITLAEAKAQIRMAPNVSAQDDLVESLMETARIKVEEMIGPIINQSWYQYQDTWPGSDTLKIYKPRVSGITAVTYKDKDGNSSTFSSGSYTSALENPVEPKIVLKEDYDWPSDDLFNVNPIRIEFVCGFGAAASDVDRPVKTAILLYVEHLYSGMPLPDVFYDLLSNYMNYIVIGG